MPKIIGHMPINMSSSEDINRIEADIVAIGLGVKNDGAICVVQKLYFEKSRPQLAVIFEFKSGNAFLYVRFRIDGGFADHLLQVRMGETAFESGVAFKMLGEQLDGIPDFLCGKLLV